MTPSRIKRLKELDFYLNELEHGLDTNAMRLVKLFGNTDHLPRIVWDNNNIIIHANQKFLERLGYNFFDVVGHRFMNDDGTSKFMTPSTLEKSIDVVYENMKNGAVMTSGVVNEWYNKDKQPVKIEWLRGFNDSINGIGTAQCKFI